MHPAADVTVVTLRPQYPPRSVPVRVLLEAWLYHAPSAEGGP